MVRGYAYTELVAPAVLFNNPGITREEFSFLLDQTCPSPGTEFSFDDPLDSHHVREKGLRDEGLYHLAGVLDLEKITLKREFLDEFGLELEGSYLWKENGMYFANFHEGNRLWPPEIINAINWGEPVCGEIWVEPQCGFERGIIKNVLDGRIVGESEDCYPIWSGELEIIPITKQWLKRSYESYSEFCSDWPEADPDVRFNWDQDSGNFARAVLGREKFLWRREGDKYYLDEETFKGIPASLWTGLSMGYVDLIATSEAIKKGAWKVLSYRGAMHMPEFLETHSDSRERVEKAIWDSHTSLYAKKEENDHCRIFEVSSRKS